MLRNIVLVFLFSAAANASVSTINCSDSNGQIKYEAKFFGYGTPPNHANPRQISEETWIFQQNNASVTKKFDDGSMSTLGAPITAQFEQSTQVILESHLVTSPGATSWLVYAVKLKFTATFEPPYSTETFVVCRDERAPPSP